MKKTFLLLLIIFLCFGTTYSQTQQNPVKDGLYLIIKMGTDSTTFDSISKSQMIVQFNKLFYEENVPITKILIDTTEYVPLELDKAPTTEQQTEQKKKLLLSLTPQASEILKTFTAKHIMERVVIVVDGEALTMHKIKVAITSGQLQITRCTDNACEKLFIMLKDNVKK